MWVTSLAEFASELEGCSWSQTDMYVEQEVVAVFIVVFL